MNFLKKNNLWFAWIVSIIAMIGSLTFSEVIGFEPCKWCWYQRIFMYPLVLLLGIAAWKRDYHIVKYVMPMSMLGLFIGTIHYLEQKIGWTQYVFAKGCNSLVPCSGEYINWLGFITIPFLSLTAFTLITFLLSINKNGEK